MQFRSRILIALMATAALAGCKSRGELVVEEGVGITAIRSSCPAVGIAEYTGDMTVFRTPGDTTEKNLDLVANISNVRTTCDSTTDEKLVHAKVNFDVQARRIDPRGARDVTLPYFVTVMRGGNVVIAKRIATVTLHFADGQLRTQAVGEGATDIDKSEATLDPAIRDRILKPRKSGDADAAVDPLADPEVKQAISRATFEVLVGFQLTDQQLTYNATR